MLISGLPYGISYGGFTHTARFNKVNKLSVRLPQNLKFVPENSL